MKPPHKATHKRYDKFSQAIFDEQEAQRDYTELKSRVSDPEARGVIAHIIKEEKEHEKEFESLRAKRGKDEVGGAVNLAGLSVSDSRVLKPITDPNKIYWCNRCKKIYTYGHTVLVKDGQDACPVCGGNLRESKRGECIIT